MPTHTVNLTTKNDRWLEQKIEKGEYQSRNEVINALISEARRKREHIKQIRAALIEGENSGISAQTPEEIKMAVKKLLKASGELKP